MAAVEADERALFGLCQRRGGRRCWPHAIRPWMGWRLHLQLYSASLQQASKLQHMHCTANSTCSTACLRGRCAWLCDVSVPKCNTTERRASTCKLPLWLKHCWHSGHWKSLNPSCTVLKCTCQQYQQSETTISTCKLPLWLKLCWHSGHWKSLAPPCTVLKCVYQQFQHSKTTRKSAPACVHFG